MKRGMLNLAVMFMVTCLVLINPNHAKAEILSGALTGGNAFKNGGTFVQLIPPIGNVGKDNHQSNNLFGFNEDQNFNIPSSLKADIGQSLLPSDTLVASHYIFFDPGPLKRAIGHVIFDAEVLAIMTSTANLAASDFLANVSAIYLSSSLRGLERRDVVTINAENPNRIDINFQAGSPGDYIRVLTALSPGAIDW